MAGVSNLRRIRKGFVLPSAGITVALAAIVLLARVPDGAAPRHLPAGTRALAKAPAPRPSPKTAASPAPKAAPAPAAAPLAPADWDAEVARARDLFQRIAVVDRALDTAEPAVAAAFIERLFERTPGGTVDDVRSLRMALYSRLALLKPEPRAVARLVAGLDSSLTRPERLAAIEALARDGALPEAAKAPLGRIANTDPDAEVRRRARVALGRPVG